MTETFSVVALLYKTRRHPHHAGHHLGQWHPDLHLLLINEGQLRPARRLEIAKEMEAR